MELDDPGKFADFPGSFFSRERLLFISYRMGCFTLANRCIIRYYKNKITPCGKKKEKKEQLIYGREKKRHQKVL